MKKYLLACFVLASVGVVAGCSADASTTEEDFGSEDSAVVSGSEQALAGSYTNSAGDRFAPDGLYRLELKKDKTFTAQRQAPADVRCVRAPCTVVFSGIWSASVDGSRLSLRHNEQVTGLRRYDLARAQDGGPLAFRDRTTGARFTMKDAAPNVAANLTTGEFKIFSEIPADPTQPIVGSCVQYTQISISRGFVGFSAHLENRVGSFGTDLACRLAVNPMPRDYVLSFDGVSCGSSNWTGSNNDGSIRITDHSTRTCRDLVPSKLIVNEKTAAGESTRFAWSVEVVDGTLVHSFGIGGENTGTSLRTSTGLVELVLSDAQRNQFVDGRVARVTGSRTTLSGVETQNRPALSVFDMLTCPAKGETLNCTPGPTVRLSNLCAPSNQSWVEAKCEGVTIVQ